MPQHESRTGWVQVGHSPARFVCCFIVRSTGYFPPRLPGTTRKRTFQRQAIIQCTNHPVSVSVFHWFTADGGQESGVALVKASQATANRSFSEAKSSK